METVLLRKPPQSHVFLSRLVCSSRENNKFNLRIRGVPALIVVIRCKCTEKYLKIL
jgi:hypothetical protein